MSNYVYSESISEQGFDEYKVCPFDPSHRILACRFSRHLTKCKQNYPNKKLRTCPFNVTHLVLAEKYDLHIKHCSDKGRFEVNIYEENALKFRSSAAAAAERFEKGCSSSQISAGSLARTENFTHGTSNECSEEQSFKKVRLPRFDFSPANCISKKSDTTSDSGFSAKEANTSTDDSPLWN